MKKKNQKSRFRGWSEHVLDAKGRLNIPARFRSVLHEEFDNDLIVTHWQHCLKVFPASCWEKEEEKYMDWKDKRPELESFIRYVVGGVTECSLDKQGRILLPATGRKRFHIDKKVVLTGMFDHFEVWDSEAYEKESNRTQDGFGGYQAVMASP